jgi:sporulation protein YlmC with PRC-barrel domain
MAQHGNSQFNWESIRGYRVLSSTGEVLGIVTDVEYPSETRHPTILFHATGTNVPRIQRISSRVVGIIASRGVYLDAVPRWNDDEEPARFHRMELMDPHSIA